MPHQSLRVKDIRIIPDRKVLHSHGPCCPFIIVREPSRIKDLDYSGDLCWGHHDQMGQTISMYTNEHCCLGHYLKLLLLAELFGLDVVELPASAVG